MKIKKTNVLFRIFDYLLFPLMWILCGLKFEFPQETHRWHMRNYSKIHVPLDKSIKIIGKDSSKYSNKNSPFFHIPILGGWKDYVILEAKDYGKYWNIGWIIKYKDPALGEKYQTQAKRIYSSYIKLLTGVNDSEKTFFAIKKDGSFANISLVDHGKIGDGKHKTVRLF